MRTSASDQVAFHVPSHHNAGMTPLSHRPVWFLALVLHALLAGRCPAVDLPVAVSADDAHLAYFGRWDTRDTAGPRCEWSGSAIELRFHGVAASVTLKDSGNNDYQIIVDGKPTTVLHPGAG